MVNEETLSMEESFTNYSKNFYQLIYQFLTTTHNEQLKSSQHILVIADYIKTTTTTKVFVTENFIIDAYHMRILRQKHVLQCCGFLCYSKRFWEEIKSFGPMGVMNIDKSYSPQHNQR